MLAIKDPCKEIRKPTKKVNTLAIGDIGYLG